MFRKLLLLSCLFGATNAFAQVSITPVKNTEKTADPKIDYTQVGAPLPAIKYLVYRDTAKKKDTTGKMQATAAAESGGKKHKKHHNDAQLTGVNSDISKPILTNDDLDNGYNMFLMMF